MHHREHSGTPEQATADHGVAGIDYRLEKFGSDCRGSAKVCPGRRNLRAVGWIPIDWVRCIAIPYEKLPRGMQDPGTHKSPLNGCRAGAGTDLYPEYRVRRLFGDGDGD
jgi:hypothetical protein